MLVYIIVVITLIVGIGTAIILKHIGKNRDVAEVLALVAGSQHYQPSEHVSFYSNYSSYMCVALEIAYHNKIISDRERVLAKREINIYINDHYSLKEKLILNGLPHEFIDRKVIYSNWNNKPQLAV